MNEAVTYRGYLISPKERFFEVSKEGSYIFKAKTVSAAKKGILSITPKKKKKRKKKTV